MLWPVTRQEVNKWIHNHIPSTLSDLEDLLYNGFGILNEKARIFSILLFFSFFLQLFMQSHFCVIQYVFHFFHLARISTNLSLSFSIAKHFQFQLLIQQVLIFSQHQTVAKVVYAWVGGRIAIFPPLTYQTKILMFLNFLALRF